MSEKKDRLEFKEIDLKSSRGRKRDGKIKIKKIKVDGVKWRKENETIEIASGDEDKDNEDIDIENEEFSTSEMEKIESKGLTRKRMSQHFRNENENKQFIKQSMDLISSDDSIFQKQLDIFASQEKLHEQEYNTGRDVEGDASFKKGINEANKEVWWVELKPKCRSDLAVHTKKIAQVYEWIDRAINNCERYQNYRLLVLTGPSGSGKTATVRAICEEMQIEIVEWANPSQTKLEKDEYSDGVSKKFDDFIKRAKQYSHLALTTDMSRDVKSNPRRLKQIILVEDFPNIKHRLLASVSKFLSTPATQSYPMIVIYSDTVSCNDWYDSAPAEVDNNSSVYSILGSQILNSTYCQRIGFNPVANTLLKKLAVQTLTLKTTQLASNNNSLEVKVKLDKSAETQLGEIVETSDGDIRCLLSKLQLLYEKMSIHKSNYPQRGVRKRGTLINIKSFDYNSTLKQSRNSSLTLFHALGKILYSKESCNPYYVLDCLPTDFANFTVYLFQSFPEFTDSIDEYCTIIDDFSCSDLLDAYKINSTELRPFFLYLACLIVTLSLTTSRSSIHTKSSMFQFQKPMFYSTMKSQNLVHSELSLLSSKYHLQRSSLLDYISYIPKICGTRPGFASAFNGGDLEKIRCLADYKNSVFDTLYNSSTFNLQKPGLAPISSETPQLPGFPSSELSNSIFSNLAAFQENESEFSIDEIEFSD